MSAEDKDRGQNSRVKYGLESDINGQFSINADTGAIYLERPLKEALSKSRLFYLTVLVSDYGVPSLASNYTYR